MEKATVKRVIGPVVDVHFPKGKLPELYHAVEVNVEGRKIVLEVVQQIGGEHGTKGNQQRTPVMLIEKENTAACHSQDDSQSYVVKNDEQGGCQNFPLLFVQIVADGTFLRF